MPKRRLIAPLALSTGSNWLKPAPEVSMSLRRSASATGAISRRFGIGGGLALLALLAATEGSEIVKTLTAGTATAGDGAKITTASGLVYSDVLVGAKNGQPGPATGAIIGADIRLSIGDKARRARAALSIARVRRTSKV